ncbi:MAG: hypothetical protein ACLFT3_16505 [Cyclobacteriaceae bacterium]
MDPRVYSAQTSCDPNQSNSYFGVDIYEADYSRNDYACQWYLRSQADAYDNKSIVFEGLGNRGLYLGGKELPDGTFFYVIDKNDGSSPKTGYLELSR